MGLVGWLLLGILTIIIIFLLVLVVRAVNFKPPVTTPPVSTPVEVDAAQFTERLANLIRCQTVSYDDPALEDAAEFEKFRQLLVQQYPHVAQTAPPERIGPTGLLFAIPGQSAATPLVFMAHYDVVPAEAEAWQQPPFAGVLLDGSLWGRGTLDTKTTLFGVMEAADRLLAAGFIPQNNWYLAFSGDEETAGASAPAIVQTLQQRGVTPAMVLDEGGAIVENVFPGVAQPCAEDAVHMSAENHEKLAAAVHQKIVNLFKEVPLA